MQRAEFHLGPVRARSFHAGSTQVMIPKRAGRRRFEGLSSRQNQRRRGAADFDVSQSCELQLGHTFGLVASLVTNSIQMYPHWRHLNVRRSLPSITSVYTVIE